MKQNTKTLNLCNEAIIFDAFVLYQFIKRLVTPFKETEAYKLGIIDEKGNVLKKRSSLKTSAEKAAYTIFDTLIFNIKKLIEKVPGGKSTLASYIAALFLVKESENARAYQDEDILYEAFSDFFEYVILEHGNFTEIRKFLIEQKRSLLREQNRSLAEELHLQFENVNIAATDIPLMIGSLKHLDELPVNDAIKQQGKNIINALRELPFKVEEDVPANTAGGGGIAGLPPDQPPVRLKKRKKNFKDFVDKDGKEN